MRNWKCSACFAGASASYVEVRVRASEVVRLMNLEWQALCLKTTCGTGSALLASQELSQVTLKCVYALPKSSDLYEEGGRPSSCKSTLETTDINDLRTGVTAPQDITHIVKEEAGLAAVSPHWKFVGI